jgi:hypothetical protein
MREKRNIASTHIEVRIAWQICSPTHSKATKPAKTAPFRAQSAIFIIGDQPVKGLYGAQCSPERSRLLGNSRFSAKLTGTSCAAWQIPQVQAGFLAEAKQA